MILPIVLGYLAGSIPFAFLLARGAGIDVRYAGSGNVGAANVLRTAGVWRGAATVALDIGKGAAAVLVARLTSDHSAVPAATGAAAILGHIYPVWLRFHGGKGVAVAAGVFGLLTPLATAIAVALFVVVVSVTGYVSLGSIAASVALAPAAWLTGAPPAIVGAAAAAAVLIVFRHRANLARLSAGSERRMRRRPAQE